MMVGIVEQAPKPETSVLDARKPDEGDLALLVIG